MWPCEIREECVIDVSIVYTYTYVYFEYVYASSFSSPYLLVFDNDRVRGTREQMMLQVELVRPRCREGIAWEFYLYIYFLLLELSCKLF